MGSCGLCEGAAGGIFPEAGAAGAESLFCQLPRSGGSGSPITLSIGDQSVTRYSILDPEHLQHPLTHGLHPDFQMSASEKGSQFLVSSANTEVTPSPYILDSKVNFNLELPRK